MSQTETKLTKDEPIQSDSQSIQLGVQSDILKFDDDDAVLRANGHDAIMPRQFNWVSALGLGFSITNSWVGYLSCFGQNLTYGGAQTCIFSLIVAFFAQGIVTVGLGELGCSGISLSALVINGIVNFWNPSYVANQWQTYLTYVGVSFVSLLPVFFASKVAIMTQITLFLSLAGYLIFFIVSIAMHTEQQPGSFLVQSGLGNSGWNDGTAWMLSISNAMYAFGGTDGVIHIREEIQKPARRVPQVMIMTLVIGLVTSLSLFIVLMFFMVDLEAVRTAPLPSLELVYQV
ncbi:Amino acid/polyamine transporter I [Penicillium expansum]|nr:Amino acid/polyamine transporter I [Penicillium expansum]